MKKVYEILDEIIDGVAIISCVVLLISVAVATILWHKYHYQVSFSDQDCEFLVSTGQYCLGCGGTHAVRALLKCQYVESFKYNCFIMLTVISAIIYVLAFILTFHDREKLAYLRLDLILITYEGSVLHCALKNSQYNLILTIAFGAIAVATSCYLFVTIITMFLGQVRGPFRLLLICESLIGLYVIYTEIQFATIWLRHLSQLCLTGFLVVIVLCLIEKLCREVFYVRDK
jgi:hypothetical protein